MCLADWHEILAQWKSIKVVLADRDTILFDVLILTNSYGAHTTVCSLVAVKHS